MMRVLRADPMPFASITYARVREGGRGVEQAELPFYTVYVDQMPQGLKAFIATSDLQGVEIKNVKGSEARVSGQYLGHAVVEKCAEILEAQGLNTNRTGAVLAGDFHSDRALQKRGGYGDVRDVWMAFRKRFKWVVGVAGNHDTFGKSSDLKALTSALGVWLLDGATAVVDGIRFSGVSGVIGNPKKPWRHRETDHLAHIDRALSSSPRFLLLHEGPSIQEEGLRGNDTIRRHLEHCNPTFVICGHRNWPGNQVRVLSNGTQVINTEGKVIVFRKERSDYNRTW